MKYYSIKITALCIILPPILYICSHQILEKYLYHSYKSELEDIYKGDTEKLIDGTLELKDSINKRINKYIRGKKLIKLGGVKVSILVSTKNGKIIYPLVKGFVRESGESIEISPIKIARQNFSLMSEGLDLKLSVNFGYDAILSYILLMVYISVSLIVLFSQYRISSMKNLREDNNNAMELDRLKESEKQHRDILRTMETRNSKLNSDIKNIRNEIEDQRKRSDSNENEMIDEIIKLEARLGDFYELKENYESEISDLKERLLLHEKRKSGNNGNSDLKKYDKRFRGIYKNVSVRKKALDGFINLTEEQKIKCEELISRLNHDYNKVVIKRKVFGKKNRVTSFEVIFSYNGRLYFCKKSSGAIDVVAIGTKNSQEKDLEYLDNL